MNNLRLQHLRQDGDLDSHMIRVVCVKCAMCDGTSFLMLPETKTKSETFLIVFLFFIVSSPLPEDC